MMDYNRRTQHVAKLPTTGCYVAVRDILNEKTSFNHPLPQPRLNAQTVLKMYELFINFFQPSPATVKIECPNSFENV